MSKRSLLLLPILLLPLAGCMISEQSGQGNEQLVFHFDTQFNRIVLFGRSAAIALVAIWLFAGSRRKVGPISFGIALLAVALGLFAKDYPRLSHYQVQVLDQGLVLAIPPEPEKTFTWDALEEIYIEGIGPTQPKGADAVAKLLELPEWHSMRLKLRSGETYEVDLELLSMEQRQTLWRAIARRAQLVRLDQ